MKAKVVHSFYLLAFVNIFLLFQFHLGNFFIFKMESAKSDTDGRKKKMIHMHGDVTSMKR